MRLGLSADRAYPWAFVWPCYKGLRLYPGERLQALGPLTLQGLHRVQVKNDKVPKADHRVGLAVFKLTTSPPFLPPIAVEIVAPIVSTARRIGSASRCA